MSDRHVRSTENLAWLLAVLRSAADELERWLSDVDANVLRAHAAQLERGHQWPGDDFASLDALVDPNHTLTAVSPADTTEGTG